MSVDRSWMERRVESHGCSVTQEFKQGVEYFLDFSYNHPQFVSDEMIKCPCRKCALLKFQDRTTVTIHLYRWGFLSHYKTWTAHGESMPMDNQEHHDPDVNVQQVIDNRYRDMVIEAAGPKFNWNLPQETPNPDATRFFELLRLADEPLWDGCKNHTRLSAVSQLMNCKSEYNMSESCYNRVTSIVKSMLPDDATLPNDFYQSKKMVKKLVLAYEKIHACPNDCILYWKENANKKECTVCRHPRFKHGKKGKGKSGEVPFKVLRYLPLSET